jgi:hypothetical protein
MKNNSENNVTDAHVHYPELTDAEMLLFCHCLSIESLISLDHNGIKLGINNENNKTTENFKYMDTA